MAARQDVVERLLTRHGRTYADECGIKLRRGGGSEMFQLLVAALLMSARISTDIAVAATRALLRRGYTTPPAMLEASWQDRVDALGEGHYVRYDESTATYLGDTSTWLQHEYGGDLRGLRAAAEGDAQRIHRLVQGAKGVGRVGADIFCREAQAVWEELRPFADDAALAIARELGLGGSAEELAERNGDPDLSVVTAALLRAKGDDDLDVVRDGGEAPPSGTQLATATRDELYELAKEHGIEGRSSMTRAELADALRG